MTLDALLGASRAGVRRMGPHEMIEAAARGALVVDTRTDVQRRRQGYSSSLAAASLRAIGLARATDLEGGVEAWPAARLPTDDGPADIRE